MGMATLLRLNRQKKQRNRERSIDKEIARETEIVI